MEKDVGVQPSGPPKDEEPWDKARDRTAARIAKEFPPIADDSEDFAQEAVVEAMAIEQKEGIRVSRFALCYKIAKHRALGRLEKRKTHWKKKEDVAAHYVARQLGRDPAKRLSHQEFARRTKTLLATEFNDPSYKFFKEVLTMKWFKDDPRSLSEICRQLGFEANTTFFDNFNAFLERIAYRMLSEYAELRRFNLLHPDVEARLAAFERKCKAAKAGSK